MQFTRGLVTSRNITTAAFLATVGYCISLSFEPFLFLLKPTVIESVRESFGSMHLFWRMINYGKSISVGAIVLLWGFAVFAIKTIISAFEQIAQKNKTGCEDCADKHESYTEKKDIKTYTSIIHLTVMCN